MDCRIVRRSLLARREPPPAVASHLSGCAACAAFASRLDAARLLLKGDGWPAVKPDAGFALRTVARLPRSTEMLGWAALRALPAALVLALAVAAYGLAQPAPPTTSLLDEPSADDLLTLCCGPANEPARATVDAGR